MTKPDAETSNLFSEHGAGTSVLMAEDITTMTQNNRLMVAGFDPGSLQISEEVRRTQALTEAVLDLKAQYADVLEPIKDLTKNVDKVNSDVAILAVQIRNVGGQVNRLEQLSERNAEHVRDVSLSVKSLRDEVADQRKDVKDVTRKADRFGLLVSIGWAIALLFLGALISHFVSNAFSDGQRNSPPPIKQTTPGRP